MQESIVFLRRVQCRRKESLRSLFHLLMSFLYLVENMDKKYFFSLFAQIFAPVLSVNSL